MPCIVLDSTGVDSAVEFKHIFEDAKLLGARDEQGHSVDHVNSSLIRGSSQITKYNVSSVCVLLRRKLPWHILLGSNLQLF